MRRGIAAPGVAALIALAGCSTSPAHPGQAGYSGTLAGTSDRPVLRLGLLDDATDATGLVGLQMRFFQQNLGGAAALQASFFATGEQEEKALLNGSLDAAYLDPISAISAGQADGGSLIRIVSGAASGGSELVAQKAVTSATGLDPARIASPETASQTAALRSWLDQNKLQPAPNSSVVSGSEAVRQFADGQIAAAWEPPPYDTLMIADGGHLLFDEASAWPQGQFTSAVLVVTGQLLSQRPAVVNSLLKGQIQSNQFINSSHGAAAGLVGNELAAALGQSVASKDLAGAFAQITYTNDPLTATLLAEARQAAAVGLIKQVHSLSSLLDLGPLNQLLRAAGQRPV